MHVVYLCECLPHVQMPEEARKGLPSAGTTGSYELAVWVLTAESGSSACGLHC